ncbi:hypothetical protein [Ancrocorticia populi]|uniref:hypothetical protein n=1 Tax=Ancrocorticia populi TaxID=2175228 RepID=UPI003F9C8A9E
MTTPENFVPTHVNSEAKAKAIAEFEQNWLDYNSATAAAIDIAQRWGMGKTTLVDWLRAEGKWPATAQRLSSLERENARLRRVNEQLRQRLADLGEEHP